MSDPEEEKLSIKKSDDNLDYTLRPSRWDEYVGQDTIKKNVKILLQAAEERAQPPEHILFYGPPGLGKTTLAHLIAKESSKQMKVTSGPAIEKVGDLAAILTNLAPGDFIFIDEIHRLNKMVEEVLYPAMESGVLDIVIGKGPSARTIQLELPPFTLIAATTRVAMVSSPLRSRFGGGVFRLDFYTDAQIESIIARSAKILGADITPDGITELAKRSRYTPRTANHLLKRARDYAQVHKTSLSKDSVDASLELLAIDPEGLTKSDRDYMEKLLIAFDGGPVGLKTMAASLQEEEDTLEEVVEPYLLQIGFIERTPRGRTLTEKGKSHVRKNAK